MLVAKHSPKTETSDQYSDKPRFFLAKKILQLSFFRFFFLFLAKEEKVQKTDA